MSVLQKCLFSDIQNFEIDQLLKYPLTVQSLINKYNHEKISDIEKNIDTKLFDPNSKDCGKIRKTNEDKKKEQEEQNKKLQKWHDFQAHDLSNENQQELQLLKYRKILNPKKAYKNQQDINHQQFQIGTFIGNKTEGAKGFLKKKEKRNKILDQFHLEDERVGFTKRKFREIQDEKMSKSRNKKWIKLKRKKIQKHNLNHHLEDMGL